MLDALSSTSRLTLVLYQFVGWEKKWKSTGVDRPENTEDNDDIFTGKIHHEEGNLLTQLSPL